VTSPDRTGQAWLFPGGTPVLIVGGPTDEGNHPAVSLKTGEQGELLELQLHPEPPRTMPRRIA